MSTIPPPIPPAPRKPGNDSKDFFKPRNLIRSLHKAWTRFPVSICWLAALTIFAIWHTWTELDNNIVTVLWFTLPFGLALSIAVSQWLDACSRSQLAVRGQIAAGTISLLFFLSVLTAMPLGAAESVAILSIFTALTVAVFFIPAKNADRLRSHWNYTMGMFGEALFADIIAQIICLATLATFFTIELLFKFGGIDRPMITCCILFGMAVPALVFLSRIPSPSSGSAEYSRFGFAVSALCRNLLLPIALVYILVLYAYAGRILVTWSLPKGQICWMVTGIVTLSMVIMYGLQSYRLFDDDSRVTPFMRRVCRLTTTLLPIVLMPLLLLMSVAIGYRIAEYGITPIRLYVATFNLWAWIAVIYIAVAHTPRLNLIAAFFAIAFLLTSIVPGFNYVTAGYNAVIAKTRIDMQSIGVRSFPIEIDTLKALLKTVPYDRQAEIADNLNYLDSYDDHSRVDALIGPHKGIISRYDLDVPWREPEDVDIEEVVELAFDLTVDEVPLSPVPTGYKSLCHGSGTASDLDTTATKFNVNIMMRDGKESTATIPKDSLMAWGREPVYTPHRLTISRNSADTIYMLTGFSLWKSDSLSNYRLRVNGYMMAK